MKFNEIRVQPLKRIASKDKLPLSSLQEIFNCIIDGSAGANTRNGKSGPEYYSWLRTTFDQESLKYKNEKKFNIKSFFPSAIFHTDADSFADHNIVDVNGIQYFDFDFDFKEQALTFKEELKNNKYILSAWLSVGGTGIGCLVHVQGSTKENFNAAYHCVACTLFNKKYDDNCDNIGRKSCISFDQELYINSSASSFLLPVDLSSYEKKEKKKVKLNDVRINCETNIQISTPNPVTEFVIDEYNNTLQHLFGGKEEILQIINTPEHDVPSEILCIFPLRNNIVPSEECNDGKEYIIYPDKKWFFYTYNIRKKKASIGKRNITMMSMICSHLMNNETLINRHGKWIVWILFNRLIKNCNSDGMKEPLPEEELLDLFISCFLKLQTGEIYSTCAKQKTIAWSSENNYSANQKRSICQTELNKIRGQKTKDKIYKAFYNLVEERNGEIPTQKMVQERTGIKSVNTISKYWKDLAPEDRTRKRINLYHAPLKELLPLNSIAS